MIIAKDLTSIFDKHTDDVMKWVASRGKPLTIASLTERYIDGNGRRYYGFPKDMMMPLERYGRLIDFMRYVGKGLSAEEDEQIDLAIGKVMLTEKDDVKKGIRIGALLDERRRRREMCFPVEVFYNYVAVQLVREDEQVDIYDNDVQMQKVEQFKEDVKKKISTYQFFQLPEFSKLNDLLKLSEQEWMQSFALSEQQGAQLKEILKAYTSMSISALDKKPGKAS